MAQVVGYGLLPCSGDRGPVLLSTIQASPGRPGTALQPDGPSPPSQAPWVAGLTFPPLGGPLSSPGGWSSVAQMHTAARSGPPVPLGN